jgi:hypothetical protein
MTPEQIIEQAKRIQNSLRHSQVTSGGLAESCELTRTYCGERNSFYLALKEFKPSPYPDSNKAKIVDILEGFIRSIENGFSKGISIERKARIDVVSDILEQTLNLLSTKGIHPAAPAVLAGAALEEFLRNWIEEVNLPLGNKKPGIDTYSGLLRESDLITKQDAKDITSWAGIRNHAAHGEWEEVSDKQRIQLMLEGINLFMRKYTK